MICGCVNNVTFIKNYVKHRPYFVTRFDTLKKPSLEMAENRQQKSINVKNKIQSIKFKCLKSVLIVFFSLLAFRATAPELKVAYISVSEPIYAYDRLIKAVVQVESAGDTFAYSPSEKAAGAFQITPIRLLDYYQRTGNKYRLEDCFNFEISKEIFLYYAKQIGYPDYETIARNWNGSGKATLVYWEKVKSNL